MKACWSSTSRPARPVARRRGRRAAGARRAADRPHRHARSRWPPACCRCVARPRDPAGAVPRRERQDLRRHDPASAQATDTLRRAGRAESARAQPCRCDRGRVEARARRVPAARYLQMPPGRTRPRRWAGQPRPIDLARARRSPCAPAPAVEVERDARSTLHRAARAPRATVRGRPARPASTCARSPTTSAQRLGTGALPRGAAARRGAAISRSGDSVGAATRSRAGGPAGLVRLGCVPAGRRCCRDVAGRAHACTDEAALGPGAWRRLTWPADVPGPGERRRRPGRLRLLDGCRARWSAARPRESAARVFASGPSSWCKHLSCLVTGLAIQRVRRSWALRLWAVRGGHRVALTKDRRRAHRDLPDARQIPARLKFRSRS